MVNIASPFQHRDEPLQQNRIETLLYRDPPSVRQLQPQMRNSRRQRPYKLYRQQTCCARPTRPSILLSIVSQRVQRNPLRLAKRRPRHATLFEIPDQPLCFLATTTTTTP